jgi:hypothetical protein
LNFFLLVAAETGASPKDDAIPVEFPLEAVLVVA